MKTNKQELIGKYKLAGKIRLISFFLLFSYLLIMEAFSSYYYFTPLLLLLFFVEMVINQPYKFILERVNILRFQYYQMATDIIAISWVLYYMGGTEAVVVSIAYYAVILWAGVVSTQRAVFFAVIMSAFLFSTIMIFEQLGFLPSISFYESNMPFPQAISLIITNIAFLFAFGYFSSQASRLMRLLEREKQEVSLRHTHKLLATAHLLSSSAHDILNCSFSAKGLAGLLRDASDLDPEKKKMLEVIIKQEEKSSDILLRLAKFSKSRKDKFEPADIYEIIENALMLTQPLAKNANIEIKKEFAPGIPRVKMNKKQMEEVFVTLILNALDAVKGKTRLLIKIDFLKESNEVKIVFSDTGCGIRPEDLKRLGEPFFTTKKPGEGYGLGLATAYVIIARHKGKIEVESSIGKGTAFRLGLPVKPEG